MLRAARDGRPARLVAVFQPHRYTPHARSARRLRPRARARRRRRAHRHLSGRRSADSGRHDRSARRRGADARERGRGGRAARGCAGGGRATRAARRSRRHARRRIDRRRCPIACSRPCAARRSRHEPRRRRRGLPVMTAGVAAPADRRFRRPDVRPARRRKLGQLAWRLGRVAIVAARRAARAGVDRPDVSPVAVPGRQSPGGSRQRAPVDRRSADAARRLERPEHPARRLRRLPAEADGFALGRRRDDVARAAVDGRRADRRARRRWRWRGLDSSSSSWTSGASSSTSSARSTRTSICRSWTACVRAPPSGGQAAANAAGVALTERFLEALRPQPDLRQRVSQIDVSDTRDVVALLDDSPTLLHLGDARFVERHQDVPRPGADAARSSSRRSTRSTSGSTSAAARWMRPPIRRSRTWWW